MEFLNSVPDNCEPMMTAKTTFEEWAREILNYFDYPFTNAYTESMNKQVKNKNREGQALSFEQLRFKVLFSTNATKLPVFKMKDANYTKSTQFEKLAGNFKLPEMEFVSGFGVDMEALLSELEER